jgi:uracil-DNA glycosylase family 4
MISLPEYNNCTNCDLCKTRKNVLIGNGPTRPKVLIIREMPTQLEDKHGTFMTDDMNFVVRIFEDVVLSKRGRFTRQEARQVFIEETFVTSAVSCRGIITAGANAGNNRDPKTLEIKACRDRLHQVIYQVDPLVILVLGHAGAVSLCKRTSKLPQKVGTADTLFTVEVPGVLTSVRYPAIYTHSSDYAERIGDYDDSNGVIAQICQAFETAWGIADSLLSEKV